VSTTPIPDAPRVVPPDGGDLFVTPDGTGDRFILDATDAGGAFSLVEHLLAPRALAAPLHLHTAEDEYSYVLEGEVGAWLGGQELVAGAGSLVCKPRNQWHTFWNAGDVPARILEIIAPGGLEVLFRTLDGLDEPPEPAQLSRLAATYGCEVDFAGTGPIVERHRLTM
jgi:mannose-6-phosphate isomerase-like protein (cupin superfamily)